MNYVECIKLESRITEKNESELLVEIYMIKNTNLSWRDSIVIQKLV